eukprot:8406796-Lingulodinium_polyedra.AAC.1
MAGRIAGPGCDRGRREPSRHCGRRRDIEESLAVGSSNFRRRNHRAPGVRRVRARKMPGAIRRVSGRVRLESPWGRS